MKKIFTLPVVFLKRTALCFLLFTCLLLTKSSLAQFTATWPLTADQSQSISGAAAANVTGINQAMSGTLFIPASNSYVGTTSGTAGDGQRCSPKQNDGNDGGWVIDGTAVEGRYMEFAVSPNAGYSMNVNTISFYLGNRSTSNLRGSVYYYVGASNAAFTMGTGTALGTAIRAGSSTNQYSAQYVYSSLNIAVASGSKIFVRIYPYNTASATTGKYFCTKSMVISGTTTTPNFTNITFTTPASCVSAQTSTIISWTGPAGFNNGTQTILAFLKAGAVAITPGTPTNNISTYTANTAFPSGTVYQGDAAAFCIYKGTGTDAFGNHSGLTITGLTANTTYQLLIYFVTGTNTYSVGATGSGSTLKNNAAPSLQVGALSRTLQTTSTLPITWTALAGTQDGLLVQGSNAAFPANPVNGTDPGIQTDLTSGTGTAKTAAAATGYNSFTGLSAGTMYFFKVNTYISSGNCITYNTSSTRQIQIATLPNPVTNTSIAIDNTTGTGTISWTSASGYNSGSNTTLVFVKSGAVAINTNAASSNPAKDPATYTANTVFGSGTAYKFDAAAFCIYNGDGNTVTVSGLSAGVTYQVLILTAVSTGNTNVGAIAGIETGTTYSTSAYTTITGTGATTYTWNAGNTAGDWTTAANWTPTRTTPAVTDQLVFNTGETITPINFPGQTIGGLTISNNTSVNIAAVSQTLAITNSNGLLNNDLVIGAGSTLAISSIMTITLNANCLASIAGTFNVNTGCTFNNNTAGDVTTVSGTLKNAGTVNCSATTLIITAAGTYEHAINGGTIPAATWNTGSTCLVSGITSAQTLMGHRQSFSKFVWDCASQSNYFILGSATSGAGTLPPVFEALDSFIIKRTNGQILQLTSSGGQRDITVGNYIQYGGTVAVTYNTNDAGGQRSLSVNNSFYVSDSLSNARFQIVNNTVDNTNGRLYVGGSVVMRVVNGGTVTLEKTPSASTAEIWFTGSTNQYAKFSSITDSVDFVTAQSVSGLSVTLASDAKARQFRLTQGTFSIGSNTLTIQRDVSYPSPGTGLLAGSSTSNLIMAQPAGNAGTLNFASGSRILKDFTQLAGNTVTLGTELAITAGLTPGRDSLGVGATLNTNDNLVLRSDANGTARMAQLPVNGSGVAQATINGKVTVERYLPMTLSSDSRRWRLLTAPFKTTNAPTINAAWQEGVSNPDRTNPSLYDPKPGYGTHITRSNIFGADGYDQGSTTSPSIYYYGAGNWVAPANTNTVKITDNGACYMLFARGDRSIIISTTSVAAKPTTLDPKGELNTGRVTIPLVASGYQAVGNPYASSIKLDNIAFNDTLGNKKTIYIWDPKTLGSFNVGKFITCSGDGGSPVTYTYTGNTSAYSGGIIESSGAFMVKGNGGNIVFNESDKVMASSTVGMASRPANTPNSLGKICKLYTDLSVIKNGVAILADGVANTYNKNYSNATDHFDAAKLTTFTSKEELSIKRNGVLFAVERRNNIFKNDTIFLNISKLSLADYQFSFRPYEFTNVYAASLEDNYLHTSTPISLTSQSAAGFSITADPASSASNRFYIVFTKNAPQKNIYLTAALQQDNAAVNWQSNDEEDTDVYEVERSTDGIHYSKVASKAPLFNSAGQIIYEWQDENLAPGNYYYRIPFTNEAGKNSYSNIAKVVKTTKTGMPSIVPNPVTDGQVNVYMGQLPAGIYNIRITNTLGQTILNTQLQHTDVNSLEKISISNKNVKGIYNLEIISANKTVTTLQLLMQ